MTICYTPYPELACASLPPHLDETLGRLRAQTPAKPSLGSVYIYDLTEQRTICISSSVAEMLGYSTSQTTEAINLAAYIHPQDLPRVAEHYQRFTTLRSGQVITIHYRMRHRNGTWCWLRSQETPLVMASAGFPLQILGIVQNMTQRLKIITKKLSLLRGSACSRTLVRARVPLLRQKLKHWSH